MFLGVKSRADAPEGDIAPGTCQLDARHFRPPCSGMRSYVAALVPLAMGLSACSFNSAGLGLESGGQGASEGSTTTGGEVLTTTTVSPTTPTSSGLVTSNITEGDATSAPITSASSSSGAVDGTDSSGPVEPGSSSSGDVPPPACGDGKMDPDEGCDDGNTDDSDACTALCQPAVCGDGSVQAGVEECDDGPADEVACTSKCLKPTCSDGAKNGDETDKDCGGGTCAPCGSGGACVDDDDCLSDNCELGACVEIATSCLDLKKIQPGAPSGQYMIDPDKAGPNAPFAVYCEQERDGGGWTLVLKVDGTKPTFSYGAQTWTSPDPYMPDPDLDRVETKLQSWTTVAATEVLVGMETPIKGEGPLDLKYVTLDAGAPHLHAVFMNGAYKGSALGRAAWKAFVANSSLQDNCNLEGFNASSPAADAASFARIRIGILGNGEMDCNTPNSYIGVGGGWIGNNCQGGLKSTTGNRALMSCDADNGTKDLAGFALVFVR